MSKQLIAIIAGAGPGTGAALARRFAQAYPVLLLSRTQASLDPVVAEINKSGGNALGVATDVTDKASMNAALDKMKQHLGSGSQELHVAAAVYNVASKFVRKPFLEQTEADFFDSLEATSKGAFNFVQAIMPLLLKTAKAEPKYPPTLIFSGATAALKGGSGLSGFAMSKFGIRALSQSLAREFGPEGVHVSHAIIDGVINTEKTKAFMNDTPDAKIDTAWIAESYFFLHTQPRTTFTQELDLRPYAEKW